jgi:hypothetical protein
MERLPVIGARDPILLGISRPDPECCREKYRKRYSAPNLKLGNPLAEFSAS